MSYLFCEKHGRKVFDENNSSEWDENSKEYTKIAIGNLTGTYYCDRCDKKLEIGEKAVYVSYLIRGYQDLFEDSIFIMPKVIIFPEDYKLGNYENPSLTVSPNYY